MPDSLFLLPAADANDIGRRERKRQQTLDHLTQTAWRLFEALGYDAVTMEQIARAANISRSEALRCFRTLAGQTPVEYLLNHRLRQAQRLLISTEKTITEIAQASGFESVAYFDRVFRRAFGCTPRQLRRKSLNQP